MSAVPATSIDPDDLPPGTSLLDGRLVIDHRIGRGGMSTVYTATTRQHRTVAIKIIASAHADDLSVCQRFRNEARLAQALADHPRVVAPYEVGEVPELGGRLYMTMPVIKGTPLSVCSDRGAWRRWVAVMADVARTVADLHDRGIVHRDIKPGNVILASRHGQDVPYLLDFGLASSTGDGVVPATAGLTRSEECPGTKFYMAPEQALGYPTAPSFDVYALALTLYELVAGMHPLDGMTATEAVRRKCDREQPSLSLRDHRPDLPTALLDAVDRALEREPERRTPSAAAFAEQLEQALASAGGEPIRGGAEVGSRGPVLRSVDASSGTSEPFASSVGLVEHPERSSATNRRRSPLAVVAGALGLVLVLGLALGLWLLRDRGDEAATQTAAPAAASEHGPDPTAAIAAAAATGTPAAADDRGFAEDSTSGHEPAVADDSTDDSGEPAPTSPPDLGTATTPAPAPKPRTTDPASDECKATRERADAAIASRDWKAVLSATAKAKCWTDRSLPRALKVQAYSSLGDHEACVKAAKHATDTPTLRTAHLCEAALAKASSP